MRPLILGMVSGSLSFTGVPWKENKHAESSPIDEWGNTESDLQREPLRTKRIINKLWSRAACYANFPAERWMFLFTVLIWYCTVVVLRSRYHLLIVEWNMTGVQNTASQYKAKGKIWAWCQWFVNCNHSTHFPSHNVTLKRTINTLSQLIDQSSKAAKQVMSQ